MIIDHSEQSSFKPNVHNILLQPYF